ncbi:M1 family metallopeptidase [Pinibacter soli]|uniref:M1 family metallopeptidase n=1 Tax=Pinibacter soli TaxID=3044211 RepID=A0ABT6RIC6_9BACT|nr:M1 family metallopeptidase [Pinibacter soli]MDI3322140.1 M1 family metallopeptidase [Pinibacter soli]
MRLNLTFFFLAFLCLGSLRSYSQSSYWQQQANFQIKVKLNDIDQTLDAFETITYTNNSPDTLKFIWFHIWPNAYKNDKTAFSEQLLRNGRTDFYFSNKMQRGYINRLDFKIDGLTAEIEDHPQYIDVVKVLLPIPLAPGKTSTITTPFHVQLPYNFSRGGHLDHSYQLTQWFPKPAVYDKKGWHEMPYLDQGEYYSEFGNYDVTITLPKDFVVAATGDLQNEDELAWLTEKARQPVESQKGQVSQKGKVKSQNAKGKKTAPAKKKTTTTKHPTPNAKSRTGVPQNITTNNHQLTTETKTLHYIQNNVIDFALFANRNFIVKNDTLQLQSGRVINVWAFYLKPQASQWTNSIQFIKDAIVKHSQWLGEYPFNTVSAVQEDVVTKSYGGMEYPTITMLAPADDGLTVGETIFHEVGHNWLQGVLATNERTYAWMDEGFNTFYDHKNDSLKPKGWVEKRMPYDFEGLLMTSLESVKQDQPINTPADQFTEVNYGMITYYKTAEWMRALQKKLGESMFDSCMHEYYRQWQFKHPQPEDFKNIVEKTSGQSINDLWTKLDKKGSLENKENHKKLALEWLFSLRDTDKKQYISLAPAIGFNNYDHLMVGAVIHDYQLPLPRLQFVLAPMYATVSKAFAGIGRVGYNWYQPSQKIKHVELAVSGAKFSTNDGLDSSGNKVFAGFYKVAPTLKVEFANRSLLSSMHKWIEWKTYLIGENNFKYIEKIADSNYYPSANSYSTRYINQLTFGVDNNRVIYPYDAKLQLQQSSSFWKATVTGNYFLSYAKGGGANVRLFAAKFGYIGSRTTTKQFENYRYMPKLTAVKGNEDYTYSNYFFGRNDNDGIASQQIMMRDGDLKILHTDQFASLPNRSDNWVAAINLSTTLPYQIIPKWIPIKLFVDFGTTADAWDKDDVNFTGSRILYVGGIQLSLLKNVINIYAPLVYSKDFKNELQTDPSTNTFGKRISFSIDIQNLTLRKIFGNKMPL